MISFWYFLIFSTLLKFSLYSCITLLALMNLFIIIILNSLCDKATNSIFPKHGSKQGALHWVPIGM